MAAANSGSVGRGKAFVETQFSKVVVSRLAVAATDSVGDFNTTSTERRVQKNTASRKAD